MRDLPASPDLSHLKSQAKHLLRDARAGDAVALRRFVDTLPAVRGESLAGLAEHDLKLHDAQSVVAREYGFKAWMELVRHVDWLHADRAARRKSWLGWVFDGNASERRQAARALRADPDLAKGAPWLACVVGDAAGVEAALARDPTWVNLPGGPFAMPPLVAVTHSGLIGEPGFEAPLLACAALLLRQGADVDGTWIDPRFPDSPLSALYGAVGRTRHAGMAKLLLDAGANPDDGESLYHSVESADPACLQLLLGAGARVTNTNAIARALDYDRLDDLHRLLRHGGDAAERPWIHHAILRGRSLAHIRALVEAGADLRAQNGDGISLFRWTQLHGRADVVDVLRGQGIDEPLTEEERFVAACTRGDEAAARTMLAETPDLLARLAPWQLRALPEMADVRDLEAVRLMLALGWPREVKAAWDATALNLAVIQGDAEMARLLLEHGADWRTPHGFSTNVIGTLSHGSRAADIQDTAPRDHIGCTRALVAHGVPLEELRRGAFSEDVEAYLANLPS